MERIHMIGYDAVHPADFIYDVPENHDYYLLILTHTPARFWQGGESRVVPAHQAALFAPQSRIRYGACGESYGNDWMIFSSTEARVTRFPLLATPFPVLDAAYCHNLFQLLTWQYAQDRYDTALYALMSLLFQRLEAEANRDGGDELDHQLLALRRSIMNDPRLDWTVSAMADRLHVSAGYLQQLYKRRFGVSCIDDVIKCRMRLAGDYLRHTHMRVGEIAALCGYHSPEHFCRQFRRVWGLTPGQYRARGGDEKET